MGKGNSPVQTIAP